MLERIPPGLIVNADDLGIHPDINAGILSAYRNGILTSCSMLVTTSYLNQTVRDCVRSEALPIGVHLSLTLGQAAAKPSEVPDLVDGGGNLKLSADRVLLRPYKTAQGRLLLQQIRREFEAQLGRALDCGMRPTHADSHQHVHMHPAIFALTEEILPRFGIRRLRFSREPFWRFVIGRDLPTVVKRLNAAKWALLRWRSGQIKRGLLGNDDLFGVLYSGMVTNSSLLALIGCVEPDRVVEICIHPGFPAPSGTTYYARKAYDHFISSSARQIEHDILVEDSVKTAVRQRGLTLRAYDGKPKH
jgi:chitin disaccharide deacetylase